MTSRIAGESNESRVIRKRSILDWTVSLTQSFRLGAYLSVSLAGVLTFWTGTCLGSSRKQLHGHVPAIVSKLVPRDHLPAATPLKLSLGLPLRNEQQLTNLLSGLYHSSSPVYHKYLTAQEFTDQFGPSQADYESLIRFIEANGLKVVGRHSNRLVLDVAGSAAVVEKAFNTTLKTYQHPRENRQFFAPDAEPSVDFNVPLLDIAGLDNLIIPHPSSLRPVPRLSSSRPNAGSAPGGSFRGKDFRTAYLPGVALAGTGQIVGLLEFDGYYANDISTYESQAGLPNVPLQNVLLNGFGGTAGANNAEVALDIEVAIAIAPGLASVMVYEGNTANTLLNRMATDNRAKQLSSSWTFGINATTENIYRQFAAQGQSMFQCSGDDGAYPGPIDTPADNPNLTVVGGTTLSTAGPNGAWTGETAWNWALTGFGTNATGGGISTSYAIPSYQKGLDMSQNQGSTIMRNIPDVAFTADNIWVVWNNGSVGAFGGTSASTPLFAGFMALVNQQSVANGHSTVGFANPALYAIGKSANYTFCFHDILTGDNKSAGSPNRFSATSGYDLCTGWGTPAGQPLINALAGGTNLPPLFNSNPFVGPTANVGQPYSGSISNLANDPNPAERLTFAKLSGPSWLVLASNGSLSGTPSAANMGTNAFVVSVSEPAGMSNTATMYVVVNGAPSFTADPITAPAVSVGQNYSGSISSQASDPNSEATLTFGKVSGPAWLSVAPDGTLSGTPTQSDVGTNSFSVMVTDSGGLSSTTTMNVPVVAPTPVTLQASLQSNSLVLTWTAGGTPMQVQVSTNLAANVWQNIGGPTSANGVALPAAGPNAFYRIIPAGP